MYSYRQIFLYDASTSRTPLSGISGIYFYQLSTISNVEELRKIIATAKLRAKEGKKKTILFIDEIHRFNKAQQDVLLPDVGVETTLGIVDAITERAKQETK